MRPAHGDAAVPRMRRFDAASIRDPARVAAVRCYDPVVTIAADREAGAHSRVDGHARARRARGRRPAVRPRARAVGTPLAGRAVPRVRRARGARGGRRGSRTAPGPRTVRSRLPANAPGITAIVVLGNGIVSYEYEGLAVESLTRRTAYNAMEGARLYRLLHPRLVVASGGSGRPQRAAPQRGRGPARRAHLARRPARGDCCREQSWNTATQAAQVAPLVRGHARFALVTSPIHMARAMALFEAEGLHPVAAPSQIEYTPAQPASAPAVRPFGQRAARERAVDVRVFRHGVRAVARVAGRGTRHATVGGTSIGRMRDADGWATRSSLASPAVSSDARQDLAERHVRHRVQHQVGIGQRQPAREVIRDRDGAHAGRVRRAEAVRRVLEHDARPRDPRSSAPRRAGRGPAPASPAPHRRACRRRRRAA